MGVFAVPLQLASADGMRLEEVEATVDTGASFTVLPSRLLDDLSIERWYTDVFELGDGRRIEQDVGFAQIAVSGKAGVTPVVFADDNVSPLLGAVTLQILSLAVDARAERLVPRVNIWY